MYFTPLLPFVVHLTLMSTLPKGSKEALSQDLIYVVTAKHVTQCPFLQYFIIPDCYIFVAVCLLIGVV